jgi:hypothetical protein
MSDRRRTGVLLILIGIGIPLVMFFIQTDGELRFFSSSFIAQRSLSPTEIAEIKKAIEAKKNQMGKVEKAAEAVKERYRKQMGEDYFKETWFVRRYSGFSIPFRYFLALGLLLILVGIGRFAIG